MPDLKLEEEALVRADKLALEKLHTGCGGKGWNNDTGWMMPAGLGEWHGVTTDAAGLVSEISWPLARYGLFCLRKKN